MSAAKIASYPAETETYAVAVPAQGSQTSRPPSAVAASQQSSNATYSTATAPPVQTIANPPPMQMHQKQYIHIDSRRPVTLSHCPKCSKQSAQTRVHSKANSTTALCVGAGVIIFWPLCWIPLCVKGMKQTNHYCTSCGTKVGRVKPFQ